MHCHLHSEVGNHTLDSYWGRNNEAGPVRHSSSEHWDQTDTILLAAAAAEVGGAADDAAEVVRCRVLSFSVYLGYNVCMFAEAYRLIIHHVFTRTVKDKKSEREREREKKINFFGKYLKYLFAKPNDVILR